MADFIFRYGREDKELLYLILILLYLSRYPSRLTSYEISFIFPSIVGDMMILYHPYYGIRTETCSKYSLEKRHLETSVEV